MPRFVQCLERISSLFHRPLSCKEVGRTARCSNHNPGFVQFPVNSLGISPYSIQPRVYLTVNPSQLFPPQSEIQSCLQRCWILKQNKRRLQFRGLVCFIIGPLVAKSKLNIWVTSSVLTKRQNGGRIKLPVPHKIGHYFLWGEVWVIKKKKVPVFKTLDSHLSVSVFNLAAKFLL